MRKLLKPLFTEASLLQAATSWRSARGSCTACLNRIWPVATTLLERGMPLEQIQKLLGHSKLETTQIYAESTPEMIKESYQRALGG